MIYECTFQFEAQSYKVSSDKGIEVFANGFWVNSDMEFTESGDNEYWIPPGHIFHVWKKEET